MRILPTILFLLSVQLCTATNYYVAKTGGTGTGTSSAQAWSWTYAKTQIPSLGSGNTIYFNRGDTFYGAYSIPVNNITIDAYGTGAKPVINGLIALTSWTSIGGGKYEKVLPTYPTGLLNMVLLDGIVQGMGRMPKAGLDDSSYYFADTATATTVDWDQSNGVITSARLATVQNFVGGEVVSTPFPWLYNRAKVLDQTSTTLTYKAQQSLNQPQGSYKPEPHTGLFFQNHINCLTQLGEWCYDSTTHKITMYFGGGNPTTHTIQVASIDSLCEIVNKTGVTIHNISFVGANTKAIKLYNASNCNFIGVDINYSGIYGYTADDVPAVTNHILIDSGTIQNVLSNGINAAGANYFTVTNNLIKNIAKIKGMGQSGDNQYFGISAVDTGSLVKNNMVDSVGYVGISFFGSNVIIRKNEVSNHCLNKADGSGIYTFGGFGQPGIGFDGTNRLIDSNIIHDSKSDNWGREKRYGGPGSKFNGETHGIYLDGQTSGVTIKDNTCFNNSGAGIFLHENNNITVRNNTSYANVLMQLFILGDRDNFSNININKNYFIAKDLGSTAITFSITSGMPLDALAMDSNVIGRPIMEPGNIDSLLCNKDESYDTWAKGGVIATDFGLFAFLFSLDQWKLSTGEDLHSTTSSTTVDNLNKIRFYYNATNAAANIDNGAKRYVDPIGSAVIGTFSLPSFSSTILLYSPPGLNVVKTGGQTLTVIKTGGSPLTAASQ